MEGHDTVTRLDSVSDGFERDVRGDSLQQDVTSALDCFDDRRFLSKASSRNMSGRPETHREEERWRR